MRGHGSQWFSHKMNNRHPLQLKKSKSWEPFGSYQLNSTANPAHLPQNRPNFEVNGLDWQCCLAGSSKRAPRIFIFSIVLGAENLSYVKSIETHARAFLPLNISAISSVYGKTFIPSKSHWTIGLWLGLFLGMHSCLKIASQVIKILTKVI